MQAADTALLQAKTFRTQPNVASIFLKSGQPYQSGDRLLQSNLARSLHLIAEQGADAFYRKSRFSEVCAVVLQKLKQQVLR